MMARKVDIREEKRKVQRARSRQMNFEQRLNEVFELTNICIELKEAFRKNGSEKGIHRSAQRSK